MFKIPQRLSSRLKVLSLIACVAAALSTSSQPAFAEGSSRPYGGGGRIQPLEIIKKYNQSGELFRIEGSCQSSCTMLLAIKNVCVEPSATLRFHAALFPNERHEKPNPKRQAMMLNSYNSKLRNYLVSNRYVETFEFHDISGSDIIRKFGYRACKG
ncbi:MAG: hypothetical protein Q8M24_13215 [Pseudolabrys sp.]|nr:hypothetical protein [Pseudolabrys sp.]MDP2296402.1 hypothetical protein [Pseudolabrys sp.]